MEQLQKEFGDAKFVKAFNSVGAALMVDPKLRGGKPTMFICGNDDGAKQIRRRFWMSLAGRRQTWARWSRRGRLSRCACCGAFRVFYTMTGCTRSKCSTMSRALTVPASGTVLHSYSGSANLRDQQRAQFT